MEFKFKPGLLFSYEFSRYFLFATVCPHLPSNAEGNMFTACFHARNKKRKTGGISEKLGLSRDTLNAALVTLENEELLVRTPSGISFTDIKAREVDRLYRRKEVSSPGEVLSNTRFHQKRNSCIQSMNQMFFGGLMPSEWYTFIDNLFNQHRFDEDVMVSLFQYCKDRDALNRKYVGQVAANWSKKKITSHLELEKTWSFKGHADLGYQIFKALRL